MAITLRKLIEKEISERHLNFIGYNKFTKSEKIGEGGFGIVSKSLWEECELPVALKCLKGDLSPNDENVNPRDIREFVSEIKILQKVSYHSHIIQFYGVTKDNDGYFYIVMQLAEGDLRNYLRLNFSKLQWTDKYRIAKEITLGLAYLHAIDIVHRDLHPRNILVYEGKMKIADFGLSKKINETSFTSTGSIGHGVPVYMDPKCFTDPVYKRDKKSDIYSLGVILWEISSNRTPFSDLSEGHALVALVVQISNGSREQPVENTPEKYVELYTKCWDTDPNIRPSINSVRLELNKLSGAKLYNSLNQHLSASNIQINPTNLPTHTATDFSDGYIHVSQASTNSAF
ncbi:kinase-like domain-containing protein [Gigaspora rosea]|uniref:Kinase-like domain-containing protein n=1 Tax=Gigaspora rosea TaxID=44941 RepID=A0A397UMB8_9GLOM|nr:kinase-like domain-containing protein [Gigaspora rosea]